MSDRAPADPKWLLREGQLYHELRSVYYGRCDKEVKDNMTLAKRFEKLGYPELAEGCQKIAERYRKELEALLSE